MLATLPDPAADPLTSKEFLADADYAWGSQVDGAGLVQVLELWSEPDPPSLMWWNTTLTDSAHHAGGPCSPIARAGLRDADARLGVWLDLLEERGLLDSTTILLTADHGMEKADPSCTGDWDAALTAAGIPFRDEAYGFLYLGVS
jgi:predicted AlkP superfamily pyrophosphatase or phosphodiesterase